MKNTIAVIILVLIFVGCDKAIQITQPSILVQNNSPKVFDTIQINCVEYAEIDGVRDNPNYFNWSILNKDHQVIHSDFKDSSAIVWVPDSLGYYVISVKIGYDNNKSITTLKEVDIHESKLSLQKKLIGKWTGHVEGVWGAQWQVDLTFDETGHYMGKGYNMVYEYGIYPIGGPFTSATHFNNYESFTPSENVPCTRFLINKTMENVGYGRLSISRETYIENNYHYECDEMYYIEELKFSDNDKTLFFSLNEKYNNPGVWYIKYNLSKIE